MSKSGNWGKHRPTYQTWADMRSRCTNPRAKQFKNYGGRGIKVCERWGTFAAFLGDMGQRPEGLTLERINNNGDYEPDNCRWANRLEQRQNQRNCFYVEYQGERRTLTDWAAKLGIHRSSLKHRLAVGWPVDLAMTNRRTHGHFGKALIARKEGER